MRKIKFRGWDEKEKRMYSPKELADLAGLWFEQSEDGSLEISLIEDSYGCRRQFKKMQYTGLKDKNGVEIYEGDLLIYADNTTPEQIFEVKFLNRRGGFVFRELYNPIFEGSDLPEWDDVILGQNAWDGWEIADEAKVIGNVFEGVDK